MMCTPLWRGISEQKWDALQLSALQEMLQEINLAEHVERANRFEGRYFANIARFETFLFFANWLLADRKSVV